MAILVNSMSDWLENKYLNWVFRNATSASYELHGVRPYLSLYTADPTDDNTVALANEVSGNGYARKQVSWYYNSSTGVNYMNYQVDFPQASAPWGVITDVGICTSLTGGSLIYHARVNPNDGVYVGVGDTFTLLGGNPNATHMGVAGNATLATWSLQELYNFLLNGVISIPNGLNIYARLYTRCTWKRRSRSSYQNRRNKYRICGSTNSRDKQNV
jgi:hypothetical protein